MMLRSAIGLDSIVRNDLSVFNKPFPEASFDPMHRNRGNQNGGEMSTRAFLF